MGSSLELLFCYLMSNSSTLTIMSLIEYHVRLIYYMISCSSSSSSILLKFKTADQFACFGYRYFCLIDFSFSFLVILPSFSSSDWLSSVMVTYETLSCNDVDLFYWEILFSKRSSNKDTFLLLIILYCFSSSSKISSTGTNFTPKDFDLFALRKLSSFLSDKNSFLFLLCISSLMSSPSSSYKSLWVFI